MNTNSIIQDYGKTVDPVVYMRALQGHPYIPQSDECGIRIITKHVGSNTLATILDLGCGPGRLTFEIAKRTNTNVIGVDISVSFIEYALEQIPQAYGSRPSFYIRDFAKDWTYRFGQKMDVIFMQGVMHHIHGDDRKSFLTRCHDLLKEDGILVISDEFIRDYDTDYGRMLNVCKFYLHIIDEARKGGFNELAEEEARNFIDDWFSGTEFAGFTSSEIFEVIYEYAKSINTIFY